MSEAVKGEEEEEGAAFVEGVLTGTAPEAEEEEGRTFVEAAFEKEEELESEKGTREAEPAEEAFWREETGETW